MGVSLNGGTQQLLVFLLKIIIWRSFGGTTILGNTHIPISMMTSERTGSEIGPKFHHTSRGPVQDSLLKVWGVFSPWAEFASFLVRLPCICDQLTKCDLTLKHSKTSNCPGFFALLPPVFTLPKTSSPPLNIFPKGKETSVLFPNITKIKKGRKKKNTSKIKKNNNKKKMLSSFSCPWHAPSKSPHGLAHQADPPGVQGSWCPTQQEKWEKYSASEVIIYQVIQSDLV